MKLAGGPGENKEYSRERGHGTKPGGPVRGWSLRACATNLDCEGMQC